MLLKREQTEKGISSSQVAKSPSRQVAKHRTMRLILLTQKKHTKKGCLRYEHKQPFDRDYHPLCQYL